MNVEIATKVLPETAKIRVRDFAKAKISLSFNEKSEETEVKNLVCSDIEIISVSSDEECNTTKKPKARRKRASKRLPAIPRGRRGPTPLKFKYHKIDEYFVKTKKEAQFNINGTNSNMNGCEESIAQNKITNDVRVVVKRIQMTENVKANRSSKRLRLTSDFDKTSSNSSNNPETKTVVNNEPITNGHTVPNDIQHEDDVLKINLTSDSENEIDTKKPDQMDTNNNDNKDKKRKTKVVKKAAQKKTRQAKKPQTQKRNDITVISKTKTNAQKMPKKPIVFPSYKIVEGTNLAVDAFRFGDIDGVENYFLSHFHADHYQGLKKSFNHTLYLSTITGRLVETFIKIDMQYLRPISINTPFIVEDVEVTALDANHCPGAVMFLFKLKTGKCILHTGDFRASPCMEEYPEFWNNVIDTIYLDTTYLSSKYDFQSQWDSIHEVVDECNEFVLKCKTTGVKPLILVGAYTIGKEKVWLSIAQALNFKVFIDEKRMETVRCINDSSIFEVVVQSPIKANIHVLPLGNIKYPFLESYLDSYNDHFGSLLAIRPSGWEANSRPRYGSRISQIGIQYSEHSSYNELHRFVRYLQPKTVISTVPLNGRNLNRTPKVPDGWLNREVKPLKQSYQTMISDFCKPQKKFRQKPKEIKKESFSCAQDVLALSSISIRDDLTVTDYMP